MEIDNIDGVFESVRDAARARPLPPWSGYEPDQYEVARVLDAIETHAFDTLPRALQDWSLYRLVPCVLRHGCYPPPEAGAPCLAYLEDE